MKRTPTTLLVFVDGLGLGSEYPDINPVHSGACPCLERLLREEAVPVDAGLGVPGLPQSATGQATLLTGLNAAKAMGRHMGGYPNHELREFIRSHNVFDKLSGLGYRPTFANAYYMKAYGEKEFRRRRSVTTVAAFKAFGEFRDAVDMCNDSAVYQDLTRESLRERGYEGPFVAPHEAGKHLLDMAAAHDFTLFEYFQTDIAAHRNGREDIMGVLAKLDEFLGEVVAHADKPGHLLLLTSDHGNIEDGTTRRHTNNPVPLVALGSGSGELKTAVHSLEDLVPALLDLYQERKAD